MVDEKLSDANRVLSPKERRQRNREEVTNAILDAARAIMRQEGVSALNLNEVARRVGMRAPSLYEYFPNKMAIYDRLFVIGIRLFHERSARLSAEHQDPWDHLRASFENYLSFAQEYPELFQLVFERHVPGFEPSEASMAESYQVLREASQYAEAAIRGGSMNPGLPTEQARDLVIALMHGLTVQHMANEPHLPIGSGRYGGLIPAAVDLLRKAWG